MANNQNVNKVVYAGTTLIDQTGDDVTAASVLSGKKFHLPSGAAATGTIATKTASNLTASGKTVTVPAGYYASQYTKDVATGSATAPASISGSYATVSTGTNTLTLSKTVSVTPSVSAGYVSSGTAGNSSVSLTASVNTRSSSDLTKSGLKVTAPAGYYASAASASVSDSNLVAGNIKSGVSIFGVSGSYTGTKPTLKIQYQQLGSGTATGDNVRPLLPGMTLMAGSALRQVYGGTLNLETGILTRNLGWIDSGSSFVFYSNQGTYVIFRVKTSTLNGNTLISNMFTKKDDNPWKCSVVAGYLYLSIPSSLGITTAEDFITYLADHSFLLIGSLTTQVTTTLTQSELAAILQ